LAFCCSAGLSADPPPDLLKRVLTKETETAAERAQYAYRQKVRIEELQASGRRRGEYREVREVIFLPDGSRHERLAGRPFQSLQRLILTEEDFRDIREVQPFLFTLDQVHLYETRLKGEETIDGIPSWVVQVRPRQILEGQRLFEGLIWVHHSEFAVVRMEGRAMPQIYGRKKENLFPRFTTVRGLVDGKYWFPEVTYADDELPFRSGPIRMRVRIDYEQYQRFRADSKVTFDETKPPQ
jgi:hypothetical protein